MARRRRKPSTTQRAPEKIAAAKYLKAQKLLSPRTKLHGGKFISRGVLKRVNEMEWIAKNNYKAVKASRKVLEEAKERGAEVVGRRLILPKGMNVERRIRAGALPTLTPIPGGHMFSVRLPYATMMEFVQALRSGEVDGMKGPQEAFSFSIYGHMTRAMHGFRSGKELAEYLLRYEAVTNPKTGEHLERDDAINHFELYRMLPGNMSLSYEQRQRLADERRRNVQSHAEKKVRRKKNKTIEEISIFAAERRRKADRERKKASRALIKATDPAKYREEIEAAKKRTYASRARKKDKK